MKKQLSLLAIISFVIMSCSSDDNQPIPVIPIQQTPSSDLLIVNTNMSQQILRIYKNGGSQVSGDVNEPVHVAEGDVIKIKSTEPAVNNAFWIKVTVGTTVLVSHYQSDYNGWMDYTFTVHL